MHTKFFGIHDFIHKKYCGRKTIFCDENAIYQYWVIETEKGTEYAMAIGYKNDKTFLTQAQKHMASIVSAKKVNELKPVMPASFHPDDLGEPYAGFHAVGLCLDRMYRKRLSIQWPPLATKS